MATDLQITARLEWNKSILRGLNLIGDKGMYMIARETLDRSETKIPKDTGKMRTSSMSGGVKGTNGNYYIGSYTEYAKYVWSMTPHHWSEPGTTNQWFIRTLNESGASIVDNALNKYWKEFK